MKTPEEIKKLKEGLKSCSSDECHGDYGDCHYKNNVFCIMTMAGEAMAYIEQLEERISLNTLRDAIYEDAVAHGLWEKTDGPIECSFLVSEEATELVNAGKEVQLARWRFSVDETEAWINYVDELADVIIASLSVAGKLGIDIDEEVRRKMEINRSIPWKNGKEEKK